MRLDVLVQLLMARKDCKEVTAAVSDGNASLVQNEISIYISDI